MIDRLLHVNQIDCVKDGLDQVNWNDAGAIARQQELVQLHRDIRGSKGFLKQASNYLKRFPLTSCKPPKEL